MVYIYIILLFLLSACTPSTSLPDTNKLMSTPNGEYSTATPNYQVTLDVVSTQAGYARSTADAAFEIGIQATDNHEERQQELARIAQDNVLLTNQSNIWTVTAAGTSVPLTQTQQIILNTQIAGVQTQQAGQMTMVKEQPTQIVAITRAKNSNQTWWIEFLIRMFVFIGMGVFFISIGIFVAKYNPPPPVKKLEFIDRDILPSDFTPVPVEYYGDTLSSANKQEDGNKEAVVEVATNPDTSYPSKDVYKFPCTSEQLDELATKTIIQGLSLAYDNFAGKGSLFTRETYAPVYSFMLRHRLSMSTGIKLDGKNKGVILTTKDIVGEINGYDVLSQWIASRTLPGTFTVEDPKPLPSSVQQPAMPLPAMGNVPHTQENIPMLEEKGSGLIPLRDLNNE